MLMWPSLPLPARFALPDAPGVYVARPWFGLGAPAYVGMSTSLRERWHGRRHHRLRDLPWHTTLSYLVCDGWTAQELRRYEAWLIRTMRPRLNGTPIRRAISELRHLYR